MTRADMERPARLRLDKQGDAVDEHRLLWQRAEEALDIRTHATGRWPEHTSGAPLFNSPRRSSAQMRATSSRRLNGLVK